VWIVLKRTVFGNWIYATGGNPEAARAAGVPTNRVKIITFAFAGFSAALLGIIQAVQFNSGNAAAGQGYVFQAPIAAVIGGVLLTGGYGSAIGILFGVCAYGIIGTGVFYTGWQADWVLLFVGTLLLLAVLANGLFRRIAISRSAG
jgi:simple sugar transport system permease protein